MDEQARSGAIRALSGCGSARESFEVVRDASSELRLMSKTAESMRAGGGRSGSAGAVSGGGVSDPMSRVDAVVDYEARTAARRAEDEALVEWSRELIYGMEGKGGICQALGVTYAEVVWLRVHEGLTWKRVAAALGYSESACRQKYGVAMDYVDAAGYEGAAAGREV